MTESTPREGSLEAPTRHPIDWKNPEFYDQSSLFKELERVFDICHGCRRCFSLCNAFPTLFDLVDESDTMEVDGVSKKDYWNVVDHCYLCDMCYMTKCPYVPPHEWNVDFPHLMLRAKAVKQTTGTRFRDRALSSTDSCGNACARPVIAQTVNFANKNNIFRKALHNVFGVHADAKLPAYNERPLRKRDISEESGHNVTAGRSTSGKVALFTTCYGNYNDPTIGEDLLTVFQHNGIRTRIVGDERCCGMPKLELGDLESVDAAKKLNIPALARLVDEGWDIVGPIPSCVLMFKQELPLMYPDDTEVLKVRDAFYDPYEFLISRHKDGLFRTDFKDKLGTIAYQVACHQRVQNIGLKTRDVLELVPETKVIVIERCSGHDGTYAVKKEFHKIAAKIAGPVVKRLDGVAPDYFTSDCVMAAEHIANFSSTTAKTHNPMTLLRIAYGI